VYVCVSKCVCLKVRKWMCESVCVRVRELMCVCVCKSAIDFLKCYESFLFTLRPPISALKAHTNSRKTLDDVILRVGEKNLNAFSS